MRLAIGLIGGVVVVAAIAAQAVSMLHAANVGVDVIDNDYQDGDGDETTTIAVGDTVTWTWVGSAPHTVTADDDSFNSGNVNQTSGTFVQTFNSVGTFAYYCQNHGAPGGVAMSGTIIVQAAAAPTATNTTTGPTATNTSGPSSTPTRTPTRTPTGTVTPQASATPAASATAATATVVTAAPISATQRAGGAAANLSAPSVGDGTSGEGDGSRHMLSAALGIIGTVTIAGAAMRRRRS
jgi:plastocyanin